MRRTVLATNLTPVFLFLAACGGSGGGTVVTILGYTVSINTAPSQTAPAGTSIPIAFTVTENESDGTAKPASGKSFTVTVTAGGGTVNGATSAALTTAANGSVSLTWVLGPTVGTQTVRGSVTVDHFLDVSVTATPPPVSGVAVTLAVPSIPLGTIGDHATAVLTDANGTPLTGRAVSWTSSNQAVATIDGSGAITTVSVGTTTITATSETKTGSTLLTVTQVPVNTVTVTLTANAITLGTVGDQATAMLKDANGNPLQNRTVTWQSSNISVATISGTGVITTVGVGTSTITGTSETKSGGALLTVTQSTWNAAWTLRKQVTVFTTTARSPAGYSVALQLDHAALVTAGKALANGNDVRVLYWTGSTWVELDRALDAGSAWNARTTTIWFATQAAINASSSDNNYYVYYGNLAATAAPANKSNVFLFADDFESGNLSKWTQLQGVGLWTVDTSRSHGGAFSLKYPSETFGTELVANPALDIADVYLDSWWYVNSLSPDWNILQMIRQSLPNSKYEDRLCTCGGPSLGWELGRYFSTATPAAVELTAPAGSLSVNAWIRVGTAMSGSTLRGFINGTEIGSASSQADLTSGNVGFRKSVVPTGATWWVDDVIARKYVNPEPTTGLGAEGAAP